MNSGVPHNQMPVPAEESLWFAGRCLVRFVMIVGLWFSSGCAWVQTLRGDAVAESQRLLDEAKIAEQKGEMQKAGMLLMQLGGDSSGSGDRSIPLLAVSGLAGASAMILPGVSGGYLLLLLGQYENILGAIDQLKRSLLGDAGFDQALLLDAMGVIVPVGIGVLIGVVGVSNAIKWLLERHAKPTLGALLGLLFGAVVGLWPFQMPVEPMPGDVIKGRVVTQETLGQIEQDDWRLERFDPSGRQIGASLGLLALGLGGTLAIARLGGDEETSR